MTDQKDAPENHGMLANPDGKRSASRATSLIGAVGLFIVAMGETFVHDSGDASYPVIAGLVAMALGPIGFNRAFGERDLKG